jgi:hypothetical protein
VILPFLFFFDRAESWISCVQGRNYNATLWKGDATDHVEVEKQVSWVFTWGEQDWTLFHSAKYRLEYLLENVVWLSISLFLKTQQLSTVQIFLFLFLRPLLSRVLPSIQRNSHQKNAMCNKNSSSPLPNLGPKFGSRRNCDLQQKPSSTPKLIPWDRKCRVPVQVPKSALRDNKRPAF